MNKKNLILIIFGTLIIGILVGVTAMSLFTEQKKKSTTEIPTVGDVKQKVIQKLELDDAQLKQIEPFLNRYSQLVNELTREHVIRLLTSFESFYSDSKPFLNEAQKEKFEKRISKLKTRINN